MYIYIYIYIYLSITLLMTERSQSFAYNTPSGLLSRTVDRSLLLLVPPVWRPYCIFGLSIRHYLKRINFNRFYYSCCLSHHQTVQLLVALYAWRHFITATVHWREVHFSIGHWQMLVLLSSLVIVIANWWRPWQPPGCHSAPSPRRGVRRARSRQGSGHDQGS